MNKIDIKGWKEFAMPDIGFKNYHGKRLKKSDRIEGNVPFITAGKENQGVVGTIGNDRKTYENPITIDMFGNVFYHEGYYAGDDNVYFFVNPTINKACKLFIVSSLQSSIHALFAYVDQFRQDNADSLTVFLPADLDGTPDWQYMENYIQQIEQNQRNNLHIINKLLPTNVIYKKLKKCDIKEWKLFKIGDLFEIKNGKGITKLEIFEHAGKLPAIQSGEDNFGLIGYLDKDYCLEKKYTISKGECLTVARSGSSGYVGYQAKQCVVGDSAKILEPKFESNTLRLLFLRSLLMVNKARYAYIDKVTSENYANDTIKLPIIADNTPDWNFMEQYISDLLQKKTTVLKQLS